MSEPLTFHVSPQANATEREPSCPQCGDTGWITVDDERRAIAPCPHRRVVSIDRRWHRRGVPERFHGLTRAAWCDLAGQPWPFPDQLSLLSRSKGEPWAVLILGDSGTGKTTLATALFDDQLQEQRADGWWLDVPFALEQVKAEFGRRDYNGQETSETRDKLYGDRLVLLDDLGVEIRGRSDFAAQLLGTVLHFRHSRCLPTIVTSMVRSVDEFAAVYGSQIASRLHEDSLVLVARNGGWVEA